MKSIIRFFWNLAGWKIVGDMPADQKKYIIIAAPHTSNWDFIVGLCVRSLLGFESNFLGKKSLFRWPLGWLFKKLGGYPVDRASRNNLVDQVVELFKSNEKFVIAIAPEGTRKVVSDWKTGFYYIALKAGVPIVRSKFDIKNKCVTVYPPYWPTGNIEADMVQIKEVYQ